MNGIVNGKLTKSKSDIPITSDSDAKYLNIPTAVWTKVPDCAYILCGLIGALYTDIIFVNAGYAIYGGSYLATLIPEKPVFIFPENGILNLYYWDNGLTSGAFQYNIDTHEIYQTHYNVNIGIYYW